MTLLSNSNISPVKAALAHAIVDGAPCFSGTRTLLKLALGN